MTEDDVYEALEELRTVLAQSGFAAVPADIQMYQQEDGSWYLNIFEANGRLRHRDDRIGHSNSVAVTNLNAITKIFSIARGFKEQE